MLTPKPMNLKNLLPKVTGKSWSDPESRELFLLFAPVLKKESLDVKASAKRLLSLSLELETFNLSKNSSKTFAFAVSIASLLRANLDQLKPQAKNYRQSSQFKIVTVEASLFALEALVLDIAEALTLKNWGKEELAAKIVAAKKCARDSLAEFSELLFFLNAEEGGEQKLHQQLEQLFCMSLLEAELGLDPAESLKRVSSYLGVGEI